MRPPVSDWETDFDHFDPEWTQDPARIWARLRSTCPVATSQRFEGGAYLPVRYSDIYAIAYNTDHFSSQRIVVREQKLPIKGMPPITSDPPDHTPARRLLLPAFSPKEVQKHEKRIRSICVSLLEDLSDRKEVDAAIEYAQHVPVHVVAHLLGINAREGDVFRRWIFELSTGSVDDPDAGLRAYEEVEEFFTKHIDQRRLHPSDDLISFLTHARVDGELLSQRHIIGALILLLVAGIETTWSAIGSALWHLATHRDDLHRLVAQPDLMSTAIEEILRMYSPVTMAREVMQETTVGGCPYAKGGQVLLSFAAANRDPEKFEQADTFIIDRANNPHAAFGLGRHRCIGSNLARLEIRIALEEWLKRFPDFVLATDNEVVWSEGQLRGPRHVPVIISGAGGP